VKWNCKEYTSLNLLLLSHPEWERQFFYLALRCHVCNAVLLNCYFDELNLQTDTVPVRTVNRQCSSGLQAVADVFAAIKAGLYDVGTYKLRRECESTNGSNHYSNLEIICYGCVEVCYFFAREGVIWTKIDVIDHSWSFSYRIFCFWQAGIGAGVETMSVNGMGLDKRVNPRVCYLTGTIVIYIL